MEVKAGATDRGRPSRRALPAALRHLPLALVATLAATLLATAAHAQLGPVDELNLGLDGKTELGERSKETAGVGIDTDHTPVAKDDQDLWAMVSGVRHGSTEPIRGSATDFDDDLYAVAFRNLFSGLAGGSTAIECPGADGQTVKRRVPALLQYIEGRDNVEDGWHRVPAQDLNADCDNPGYVGALAWITSKKALAVGGSGEYPKREPAYSDACQRLVDDPNSPRHGLPTGAYGEDCDRQRGAGMARAWLYENGRWRELDLSRELARGMRGLSVLAADPLSDSSYEFAVAGALGQLWLWQADGGKPGRFTRKFASDFEAGRDEPGGKLAIRFRVRDIEFVKSRGVSQPKGWHPIFAVTAGCCARDALRNFPRLIAGDGDGWNVVEISNGFVGSQGFTPHTLVPDPAGAAAQEREIAARQDLPDSAYSLTVASVGGFRVSAILAPGGPPSAAYERPSTITQAYCLSEGGGSKRGGFGEPNDQSLVPDQAVEALRISLSTARLVAGDGDVEPAFDVPGPLHGRNVDPGADRRLRTGSFRAGAVSVGCYATDNGSASWDGHLSDGVPDWTVGELRSTHREGLGARALAFSPNRNAALTPETVYLGRINRNAIARGLVAEGLIPPEVDPADATSDPTNPAPKVTTKEKLQNYVRSAYFLLPSYSLNAIDVIDPNGVGWAVGEHGAIMRLDESASATFRKVTNEPPPPRIGTRRPAPLAERAPYEAHRPSPAAEPGAIPALASRPRERPERPRFVSYGAPDPHRPTGLAGADFEDVHQIVTSRDGQQGWALGSRTGRTTLFRLDGAGWSRCDPVGVEGQLEPDPACEALRPLAEYSSIVCGAVCKHTPTPLRILAAARVPLENDSDPANEDEFEILAVGTPYLHPGEGAETATVLRYRDGRWSVADDPQAEQLRSLLSAGTAPRELVLQAPDEGWLLDGAGLLLRLEKGRWSRCGEPGSECALGAFEGVDLRRPHLTEAGGRAYLFGSRSRANADYPLILHHERGRPPAWSADPERGGYDPGAAANPDTAERGAVDALAIARRPDGELEGWAAGRFGILTKRTTGPLGVQQTTEERVEARLLNLEPGGRWRKFHDTGALRQGANNGAPNPDNPPPLMHVMASAAPRSPVFIVSHGSLTAFNPEHGRFEHLPAQPYNADRGGITALAPDERGGLWLVGYQGSGVTGPRANFFNYTPSPPREVFEPLSSPLRAHEPTFTALASRPDGTLFATASSGDLYRYDRLTGWDRVAIPGWRPARATVFPRPHAIAIGPGGQGLVVGAEGRIAGFGYARGDVQAAMDRAAGVLCEPEAPVPPCGTSRDLRSAAVAPDGSAIAGGDRLSLLWRPAGGEFRAIERPAGASPAASFVAAALPTPERAFVVTNTGLIFAGRLEAGRWSWALENVNEQGEVVPLTSTGNQIPLRAIALDAAGRGYAVGDQGTILRRDGDGPRPWRRLSSHVLYDLTAIALAPGGERALIGGKRGLVLTGGGDRFEPARPAEYHRSESAGPVSGLAISPGVRPGQVEAWALVRGHEDGFYDPADPAGRQYDHRSRSALLHYASDPGEPLLDPEPRARPLPDAPAPRPGELGFAALGNTVAPLGRALSDSTDYPGLRPAELFRQALLERIGERARAGQLELAVFTGDIDGANPSTGEGPDIKSVDQHLGFIEEVIEHLEEEADLPLFAALGARDRKELPPCRPLAALPAYAAYAATICVAAVQPTARHLASPGENFAWRKVMRGQPKPWGGADPARRGALAFKPVRQDEGPLTLREGDTDLDPDGEEGSLPKTEAHLDGAATHYAFDLADTSGERDSRALARFVFADNAALSLAASDPFQQPLEARGQAEWLERMLCTAPQRAKTGERCTRRKGQPAIVVATTPTYAHGPTNPDQLARDGASFEELLMRERASLVVSGRLGWNGLYWATAPGVHEPCPGSQPQAEPPEAGRRLCGRSASGAPEPDELARRLGEALSPLGPPPAPEVPDTGGGGEGILPFVVSSTAGGPFGASGSEASAERGFWRGYSVVRLDRGGDPRKTIVEQRPVLDWVRVEAQTHVLRPRQRMTLRGFGREVGSGELAAIRNASITHRYDLVEADPERPWLPRQGADGRYVALDPSVATVDSESGVVRTGRGNQERTYALGVLSVGCVPASPTQAGCSPAEPGAHVATYPLVFEPRRSFRPKLAQIASPLPAPKVLSAAAAAIQSPQAPPPVNPPSPQVDIPPPPTIPPLPGASANPPQPPQPPAPPPPPVSPQATPLDLVTSPIGLNVGVQATVIPPPAPPIQPAPPSGARREARQRQAATQKSGADVGQSSEVGELGGDLAQSPNEPGTAATRRDRIKPGHSITTVTNTHQPSAWPRNLAYGGGLTLAALLLAGAYLTARPTPRRRHPELPAPARARLHR